MLHASVEWVCVACGSPGWCSRGSSSPPCSLTGGTGRECAPVLHRGLGMNRSTLHYIPVIAYRSRAEVKLFDDWCRSHTVQYWYSVPVRYCTAKMMTCAQYSTYSAVYPPYRAVYTLHCPWGGRRALRARAPRAARVRRVHDAAAPRRSPHPVRSSVTCRGTRTAAYARRLVRRRARASGTPTRVDGLEPLAHAP